MIDKRKIGQQYEQRAMQFLNKFGALSTEQIAALIYKKIDASSIRQAQRLTQRLSNNGMLLHRNAIRNAGMLSDIPKIWGLSERAARYLRETFNILANNSSNALERTRAHRIAANWAAIALTLEEFYVSCEREIYTNRCFVREINGKIPDGIAWDEFGQCIWIEVENCERNSRDMKMLTKWLINTAFPQGGAVLIDPPIDTKTLRRVRFVLSSTAARAFPKRLYNAIQKCGYTSDEARDFLITNIEIALSERPYPEFFNFMALD